MMVVVEYTVSKLIAAVVVAVVVVMVLTTGHAALTTIDQSTV